MRDRKKGLGSEMIGVLIYVCISALGLTLIKVGLGRNSTLAFDKAGFSMKFSWLLILGMCLYVLSFLLSLIVMKGMNLSLYYPLTAGLIYIIVCMFSVLILKEKIVPVQLIGMAIIFAGIIVMNIGKGN
ncbi:MAG: hypothetical protein K2P45_05850 [Eubacterium sp.]|nr:hypothetical protein [Eubacterium sp.]